MQVNQPVKIISDSTCDLSQELVEKYAMPKTSIYRKRDDALKKLKKILGNA